LLVIIIHRVTIIAYCDMIIIRTKWIKGSVYAHTLVARNSPFHAVAAPGIWAIKGQVQNPARSKIDEWSKSRINQKDAGRDHLSVKITVW